MRTAPVEFGETHRQIAKRGADGDVAEAEFTAHREGVIGDEARHLANAALDFPALTCQPFPALRRFRAHALEEGEQHRIADAVTENLEPECLDLALDVDGQERRLRVFQLEKLQDEAGVVDGRAVLEDEDGQLLERVVSWRGRCAVPRHFGHELERQGLLQKGDPHLAGIGTGCGADQLEHVGLPRSARPAVVAPFNRDSSCLVGLLARGSTTNSAEFRIASSGPAGE